MAPCLQVAARGQRPAFSGNRQGCARPSPKAQFITRRHAPLDFALVEVPWQDESQTAPLTPSLSAGELLLFAYLYQMSLCKPDVLAATPKVGAWYAALLRSERVQKVVTGKSSFGEMKQYFITPAPAAE